MFKLKIKNCSSSAFFEPFSGRVLPAGQVKTLTFNRYADFVQVALNIQTVAKAKKLVVYNE